MLNFSQCYIHSIRAGGRSKQTLEQTFDSARKHYCSFLNISFKSGSNFTLVSHEKPILQFVYKARDRVLGPSIITRNDTKFKYTSVVPEKRLVGLGCFGFNGPLRQCFRLF